MSSSAPPPVTPLPTTAPVSSATGRRSFRRRDTSPLGDATDAEIDAWVARAGSFGALETLPALNAFQRRMERFPTLSAEAQLELVAKIRAGEAADEMLASRRRIGVRQRKVLADESRTGKEAVEWLVGANFRLVLLICRERAEERFGRERAMDMMGDLVGEALVALTKAIREFDEARCPVFATYAARVVRDTVSMTISRDGPMKMAPSWSRLKRIAAVRMPQLAAELGRQPTEDEIREDLMQRCLVWAGDRLTPAQKELPEPERRRLMMAKLRKQGMLGAIASLGEVLTATQPTASLDAFVGDEAGATLGDLVVGEDDSGLLDDVAHEQLAVALADAMSSLNEREQAIIRLRFGFDGERLTYAAIGEQFGVTAERIRQIERNVLSKLASPTPSRDRLASFLPSLDGATLGVVEPDPSAGR